MTSDSSPSTGATAGRAVLTVSRLTEELKECVQTQFSGLWVAGEVSDLSRPQSGHVYFSLKDEQAKISAAMWRSSASRLNFDLEDGMEVLCFGGVDIYPPRGNYQLIVRDVELRGEGGLQRALRQLQERLAKEGLFDPRHKKPLPKFPRRVAIVTSPTGAAIRDFLEVARRRWHETELVVLPVPVQGAASASQIAEAVRLANHPALGFDVIVVTRGGGSMEDLWGFNDEQLVREIHTARVPVVSAVGHEIDVTLADLVADVRALTPSEAAERVLPSMEEVHDSLRHLAGRMENVVLGQLERARSRLDSISTRRVLAAPSERLQMLSQRVDELDARGQRAVRHELERSRHLIARLATQLESLSPLGVLGRGYSLTMDAQGKVIRSLQQVQVGGRVTTRLSDGEFTAKVEQSEPFTTHLDPHPIKNSS